MTAMFSPRHWATKLVIGAFLLMSSTGVLMFFELAQGLTVVVHQWASWILLIGAAGHIATNIRSVNRHLSARWGTVSVLVFSVILGASCFSWGAVTGPQLKRPIEKALVDAPITLVSRLSRVDPQTVAARLNAVGIDPKSELSVRELAVQHHEKVNRLLGLVFLMDEPSEP